MNNEVTLANAEWCRKQAAKYLKLAASIEDILTEGKGVAGEQAISKQAPLFVGNKPSPSFEQVQKEAAKGGRTKNVADRLGCDEQFVRDMMTTPNSKYFIGDKGWIRPKGWVPPKKP